jgi:hypothetical protein
VRRLSVSLAGSIALSVILGTAAPLRAEEAPCEPAHGSGYAPVVTACGDQIIQRYPLPPTLENGRWVIEDQGQQFTLVENIHVQDYLARDAALEFHKETGIPIRFGWAHPFDGPTVSGEVLKEYIGIYVASESVGEWMVFGLPLAHVSPERTARQFGLRASADDSPV